LLGSNRIEAAFSMHYLVLHALTDSIREETGLLYSNRIEAFSIYFSYCTYVFHRKRAGMFRFRCSYIFHQKRETEFSDIGLTYSIRREAEFSDFALTYSIRREAEFSNIALTYSIKREAEFSYCNLM
jgi:hypothetical protein